MSLPANFEGRSGAEPHRLYRNLCIEFKKLIETSYDIDALQIKMEEFLNASKEMQWKTKGNEAEKVVGKVWTEFKRYIFGLTSHRKPNINNQDLIEALADVERLVKSYLVH